MVGLNIMPTQLTEHARGILLVLSSTEESALRVERQLRNAGYPMRAAWICDLEDLDDALRGNPPDLLLCEAELPAAPFGRVVELCRKLRPELPLLKISATVDASATATALAEGAQDCVSTRDAAHLRHLEHVVLREIINYDHLCDLNRARERLKEFESRHRQLTEGTADAVARTQEGILVEANVAFAALLGQEDFSSLAGTPLIDLVIPEQRNRIKQSLRLVLKGKHGGEPLNMTLDGGKGPVEIKAQIMLNSVAGEPAIEILVPHQVVGANAAPVAERAAFLAAMNIPLPPGSTQLRAAVFVKLDAYGELEERTGMIDAEAIRGLVGNDIHQHLEDADTLTLFSSDEFALLICRTDLDTIESFIDSLRAGIGRQIFSTTRHEAQVTVSVTVYPLGADERAADVLRQLVEEARQLSAAGGDRTRILGDTAKQKMTERENQRIASQVRAALEGGRMKLAYQVISNLEDPSGGTHFDVLLRMLDEAGNESHAGEFLPQAQKAGMMRAIDRWVLSRVANVLVKRQSHQTLFTKLSEETVAEAESFMTWLPSLLKQYPLNPESLVIEIRESTLQMHVRKAHALCEALHKLGVGVAIEQFGLGSASLKLLEHVPTQYIKFHPDFTRDFEDKNTQRRLKELLEAARRRDIKTIICYIEDAGVMAGMWQMGANFVQGFGVQEPGKFLVGSDTPLPGVQ